MAAKKMAANGAKKASGANAGFEAQLWAAVDALRGSMEATDYKHDALELARISLQRAWPDFRHSEMWE